MSTVSDHAPETGDPITTRSSLSERIYVDLRLALMSGTYEPGDKINIRKLSIASQTSSTPVREAVMQLVREGALELKLGYQPRVPTLSAEQYIKIREVRAPLERLATELATVRVSDAMLARLASLDQQFIDAERLCSWKEAMRANQEYHFLIYKASGNDVLVRTIENLWLLTGPLVHKQYLSARRTPSETTLHRQIIDALARRVPNEAGDLIVQDMRQGSAVILDHLRHPEPRGRGRRAAPSTSQ
jgi:DNA-binding GntR family transcriptional regulator